MIFEFNTFTILGRCARTGALGVATTTGEMAVGSRVPFVATEVGAVATQALTLLNNPFVLGQASLFAERVEQRAGNDVPQQVDLVYDIALTRLPTEAEAAIARQLVEEQSLVDLTHVIFNLSEFLYLR